MMRRFSLVTSVAALALAAAIAAGGATREDANAPSNDTYKALDLFAQVFEKVRANYVEPVSDDQLVEDAVSGMVSSLDPHSSYMDAKAFKDFSVQTKGEFGGLGVEVVWDPLGAVKVVSPIDDTPGAKAGLKAGDLIVALDGTPVANLTLQESVEKMRGAPGTSIKLSIRRPAENQGFDVTLTRAVIHVASVKSHLERGTIAYIRLAQFQEQSGAEVHKAYEALKAQANGKLTGVVLDLRSDPGGLLDQAVAVSSAFLDHGEVVSTRGRRPDDVQRFNAHGGDMTGGLPLVILIDGGTASASEIVAGALQDHHRAVILGTRSFGKGSVQTIIPVTGGGAMRLTTARYFTPSGRSIQAEGIQPDIEVEPAKIETIAQVERLHEADLKKALKNPDKKDEAPVTAPAPQSSTAPPAPASGPAGSPAAGVSAAGAPSAAAPVVVPADGSPAAKDAAAPVDASAQDYQLTRALDLLKGVAMFSRVGE